MRIQQVRTPNKSSFGWWIAFGVFFFISEILFVVLITKETKDSWSAFPSLVIAAYLTAILWNRRYKGAWLPLQPINSFMRSIRSFDIGAEVFGIPTDRATREQQTAQFKRTISAKLKTLTVLLSIYALEWAMIYYKLIPAGRYRRDDDFVNSGLIAVPATILTVYLFNRFTSGRKISN